MSSDFTSQRSSVAGSNCPTVWKLGLAGLLIVMSVMLVVLQIFPASDSPFTVLASKLGLQNTPQRFPKGQLEADAKTLIAALQYLLAPQVLWKPTARPSSTALDTNQPVEARYDQEAPALGSDCIRPNMLPSVSLQYASQPRPGMGIFGSATEPPSA